MPQSRHLLPNLILSALFCLLGLTQPAASAQVPQWEILSHFPPAQTSPVNTQRKVLATDGARFFAYGGEDGISYTDDGFIWKIMTTPTDDLTVNLVEVIQAGDRLVGVDGSGNVLHSTDGFNWQQTVVDAAANYRDVAFNDVPGQEQILLVGDNGTIATSTNADPTGPWTTEILPDQPDLQLAAFGNEPLNPSGAEPAGGPTWVVVGVLDSLWVVYLYDTRGAWTKAGATSGATETLVHEGSSLEVTDIIYDSSSGEFVIAGTEKGGSPSLRAGVFGSSSGQTWGAFERLPVTSSDAARLMAAGAFAETGDGVYLLAFREFTISRWIVQSWPINKSEGTNRPSSFTFIQTFNPPEHFDFVGQVEKSLMVAGNNEIELYSSGSSHSISNRTQFRYLYLFPDLPQSLVLHFNLASAAVGADGNNLELLRLRRMDGSYMTSLFLEEYRGYVYAGATNVTIYRSPNFVDWENSNLPAGVSDHVISGCSYGEVLLAGSNRYLPDNTKTGIILRTTDGTNWESHDVPLYFSLSTENTLRPAEDGFLYFWGGSNFPHVWHSPDGITWQQLVETPSGTYPIAYGNRKILFEDGDICRVYDRDLGTWSTGALPVQISFSGGQVFFTHGQFFLIKGLDIWRSLDGIIWEKCADPIAGVKIIESCRSLVYDAVKEKLIAHFAPVTLVTLPYTFDRLADWRTVHNCANQLESEDFDGDGLTLLEEYARGHDPHVADRSPQEIRTAFLEETALLGGSGFGTVSGYAEQTDVYMTLTFDRRTDDPRLQFEVQEIVDLADPSGWQPGGVLVGHPLNLGPGMERVTYRATHPLRTHPNSYMRVKITRTP